MSPPLALLKTKRSEKRTRRLWRGISLNWPKKICLNQSRKRESAGSNRDSAGGRDGGGRVSQLRLRQRSRNGGGTGGANSHGLVRLFLELASTPCQTRINVFLLRFQQVFIAAAAFSLSHTHSPSLSLTNRAIKDNNYVYLSAYKWQRAISRIPKSMLHFFYATQTFLGPKTNGLNGERNGTR